MLHSSISNYIKYTPTFPNHTLPMPPAFNFYAMDCKKREAIHFVLRPDIIVLCSFVLLTALLMLATLEFCLYNQVYFLSQGGHLYLESENLGH